MPSTTLDEQLANVTYNEAGLVPAIAQDHETGAVLMLAWMNEATLRETLETGRMVYWRRSRQEVWRKGDTPGDTQLVREAATTATATRCCSSSSSTARARATP